MILYIINLLNTYRLDTFLELLPTIVHDLDSLPFFRYESSLPLLLTDLFS